MRANSAQLSASFCQCDAGIMELSEMARRSRCRVRAAQISRNRTTRPTKLHSSPGPSHGARWPTSAAALKKRLTQSQNCATVGSSHDSPLTMRNSSRARIALASRLASTNAGCRFPPPPPAASSWSSRADAWSSSTLRSASSGLCASSSSLRSHCRRTWNVSPGDTTFSSSPTAAGLQAFALSRQARTSPRSDSTCARYSFAVDSRVGGCSNTPPPGCAAACSHASATSSNVRLRAGPMRLSLLRSGLENVGGICRRIRRGTRSRRSCGRVAQQNLYVETLPAHPLVEVEEAEPDRGDWTNHGGGDEAHCEGDSLGHVMLRCWVAQQHKDHWQLDDRSNQRKRVHQQQQQKDPANPPSGKVLAAPHRRAHAKILNHRRRNGQRVAQIGNHSIDDAGEETQDLEDDQQDGRRRPSQMGRASCRGR